MINNPKESSLLIEAYRNELLRWNKQINLVSRQETEGRLDSLFNQCIGGHQAIMERIQQKQPMSDEPGALCYFDLGSGGGLPGIIWHILFAGSFSAVDSYMVEPREKRAWFLSRINNLVNMPDFSTLCGRWGDVIVQKSNSPLSSPDVQTVVISLKALHLDDILVLRGLCDAFHDSFQSLKGATLILARYYPPGQLFDDKTSSLLKIQPPGEQVTVAGRAFTSCGGDVVALGSQGAGLASLVLSSYLITV